MKRHAYLACAVALVLAGCSSGPAVRAVSDPQADFATYRTFGFVSELGTDRNGFRSQLSDALKVSTRREMEARGLVYAAENPQLLVNFNAEMANRVRINTTSQPVMGMSRSYYGYRRGFYTPFPRWQDQTTATQYREGTLNVDVADAAARRLIWEGVVTQTVRDRDYADLSGTIDRAIVAAFARFPIKAPPPAKD